MPDNKKNILFDIFITFAKIGLFTFGGGYAMLSIIEHNCVEKKKWISHDEMMNVMVIAESTPGPISINCATFAGYKQAGIIGAVLATLGIVLPSFILIYIISIFLDNFLEITIIANAFNGIKAAVGILILNAAVTMIKKMSKKLMPRIILICSSVIMLIVDVFSLKFSSINLIIIFAVISLLVFSIKGTVQKGGNEE